MPANTLLTPNNTGLTPEALASIASTTKALTAELYAVASTLHANPELAWGEHVAHDTLTAYMDKQKGWTVTRKAYGFDTAWKAEWTSPAGADGGPVVGFNSEMDALKGVGHACGHNLIAVLGVAAALATAAFLTANALPGRIILLGTPAEEYGGGKTYLLKAGAYDAMDMCMMAHPMGHGDGAGIPLMACAAGFTATYKGASSHAAGAPWKGVNALDAAVAAYTNVALLRQQIPDGNRVCVTIKGSENWSCNVIAANAQVEISCRTATGSEMAALIPRAIACLEAGALATGCSVHIEREMLYLDVLQQDNLAEYLSTLYTAPKSDAKPTSLGAWGGEQRVSASTDFGVVSYRLPALHPGFDLPDAKPGDFPHTDTFATWTGLESSTVAAMKSAAGLASLASRAFADSKWLGEVKAGWRRQMDEAKAEEVVATLDETMERYELGKSVPDFCMCYHGDAHGKRK